MTPKSLVIFKPDVMASGEYVELMKEFRAFPLRECQLEYMTDANCLHHYSNEVGKPHWPGLLEFMTSGPSLVCCYEGDVGVIRQTALDIRRRYANIVVPPRNLIHASDSEINAYRELEYWFYPDCYKHDYSSK